MKLQNHHLVTILLLFATWSCTNNASNEIDTLWQKVCTSATKADEIKNVEALAKYMQQKSISFGLEAKSINTGTIYNLPYVAYMPTNDTFELKLIVSAPENKKIKSNSVWKPLDEKSIFIFFQE